MAKKEYPWFPMYAAEMLADGRFQGWTLDERGAWLTLLGYCWNDGSIPSGLSTLAKLLHVGAPDMSRIWSVIGDRFLEIPDRPGRLTSPRLEAERDKARELSNRRAEAGFEGATARWQKQKQPHGKGMRLPPEPHSKGTANGCPVQSQSQSPEAAAAEPIRLPSRGDRETERWPNLCALSARLGEAWGLAPSLPKGDQARTRLEADVLRLGLELAEQVCEADVEDAIRRGALRDYPDSLGWSARALGKARRQEERPPAPDVGDLGVELHPWFAALTEAEIQAYCAERRSVAPDMDGAPIGMDGPAGELSSLNAKWRAKVESRARA